MLTDEEVQEYGQEGQVSKEGGGKWSGWRFKARIALAALNGGRRPRICHRGRPHNSGLTRFDAPDHRHRLFRSACRAAADGLFGLGCPPARR